MPEAAQENTVERPRQLVATLGQVEIWFEDGDWQGEESFKAGLQRIKVALVNHQRLFIATQKRTRTRFIAEACRNGAEACEHIWKTRFARCNAQQLRKAIESGPLDLSKMVLRYQEKHFVETPDYLPPAEQTRRQREAQAALELPIEFGDPETLAVAAAPDAGDEE